MEMNRKQILLSLKAIGKENIEFTTKGKVIHNNEILVESMESTLPPEILYKGFDTVVNFLESF